MVSHYKSKTKRKKLEDGLSSSEKAKIHASRKFPRNAETEKERVLNTLPTLVKNKKQIKPAVITKSKSKLPKIDDFLTFLCFRGTSILPPSLNINNKEEQAAKPVCISVDKISLPSTSTKNQHKYEKTRMIRRKNDIEKQEHIEKKEEKQS